MHIGASTIFERLRSSLWFVPSVMAVLATILAIATVNLDQSYSLPFESSFMLLYSGGPTGARAILSTTAGSMITIAGVSFSIVIVALSLASNQFGPRLLRNFMRDRGNQVVLGTFIGTFIYCLLVLGSIRSVEGEEFVPYVATTVGILLALCSLAVLIYFIHHVSESIQADHVVMVVAQEFDDSIERLFPEQFGSPDEKAPDWSDSEDGWELKSPGDGYLEAIDPDELLRLATENDLTIDLQVRPGMFLTSSSPMGRVCPASSQSSDLTEAIQHCFIVGSARTIQQDVGFAIEQLVEVAVRSLSPSLNDPFTATGCLDRLLQGFVKLAGRKMPAKIRCGTDGKPRLRAPATDFGRLAHMAFDPIRHYGSGSPIVLVKMLEVLETLISTSPEGERRALFEAHAIETRLAAEGNVSEIKGRRRVNEAFEDLSRS